MKCFKTMNMAFISTKYRSICIIFDPVFTKYTHISVNLYIIIREIQRKEIEGTIGP